MHTIHHDFEGAEECFERILKLEPDHANALYRYGALLHAHRNDIEGAERCLRRALEVLFYIVLFIRKVLVNNNNNNSGFHLINA